MHVHVFGLNAGATLNEKHKWIFQCNVLELKYSVSQDADIVHISTYDCNIDRISMSLSLSHSSLE